MNEDLTEKSVPADRCIAKSADRGALVICKQTITSFLISHEPVSCRSGESQVICNLPFKWHCNCINYW